MSARGWGWRPAPGPVAAALAAGLLVPGGLAAQGLDQRVAGMEDGMARFHYATRPGVEICARGIRMGEDRHVHWNGGMRGGWDEDCHAGPAEVELRVRDGRVSRLEVLHGHERRGPTLDLGSVSPEEAVAFLVSVARNGRGDAAEDAVFAMVLADAPRRWEPLLELARDRGVASGARENALFWLGQEAAEVATEGLAAVASDGGEEQEIREAAIFALSQRPDGEAVPVLMELARDAAEADTRRSALFWLAQSDAPEVVEFFAEILRGGAGS